MSLEPHPSADSPITQVMACKPLVEMSDEELTAHLASLRASIETPQSLKKAMSVSGAADKPKSASKAQKTKAAAKSLLDGLL